MITELQNTFEEINSGIIDLYIDWFPFFVIFQLIGITAVLNQGHYRTGIISFLYITMSFALFYCLELFFSAYIIFTVSLLIITPITVFGGNDIKWGVVRKHDN